MPVLVLAEHDDASLKSATLHAITAARQLGDPVQGLAYLVGMRALGLDVLELGQPAAHLGKLGRNVRRGIHFA